MADELLLHVCQRIDALTYDDHSSYLLGSLRAASIPASTLVAATPASGNNGTLRMNSSRRSSLPPTATISSRRRRANPQWARIVGLTSYYVGFVLLLGLGWFIAMMGIFVFLFVASDAAGSSTDQDPSLSHMELVLALSAYFLGGALGCVLFGSLADHFGRRRVLLAALGEWLVANAVTGAAWDATSLIVFRCLSGLGIGGQLCLLVTISLEYTPKRTRGRITVVSVLLATMGIVAGVAYGHLVMPIVSWRAALAILSGGALLYGALLFFFLEESPKYLASVGRVHEALRVLAVMETAHGIDRQARVPVPTSLYAPPVHQQLANEGLHRISQQSQDSSAQDTLTELTRGNPHLADFLKEDTESTDRQPTDRPGSYVQTNVHHGGGRRGTLAAASPAMLSFPQSLRRRAALLLAPPFLARTLLLWLLWFALGMSLAAALAALLVATTRRPERDLADQLAWSALTVPGIVLAAVLVERAGRKPTLALFVLLNGAVLLCLALLVRETSAWPCFFWIVAALSCTGAGSIGAAGTFTGEQYPLMVRALGTALAVASGHLGMLVGALVVLYEVVDAHWQWPQLRVVFAAGGAVCLLLLPVVVLTGVETKGHDVDTVEWHRVNANTRRNKPPPAPQHQPSTHLQLSERQTNPSLELDKAFASSSSSSAGRRFMDTTRSSTPVLMANGGALDSPSLSPARGALDSVETPPLHSPASDSSSSSSGAGFWQKHSVHRLRQQVAAVAAAVRARKTFSGATSGSRKFTTSSRSTTLPADDLDLLDTIVTANEGPLGRPRRATTSGWLHFGVPTRWRGSSAASSSSASSAASQALERPVPRSERHRKPVLEIWEPTDGEWRGAGATRHARAKSAMAAPSAALHSRFLYSSDDESSLSSLDTDHALGEARSSDGGSSRYTIDLDMFDTFTFIATPVLGDAGAPPAARTPTRA